LKIGLTDANNESIRAIETVDLDLDFNRFLRNGENYKTQIKRRMEKVDHIH
jgi:hypothetical protein